MNQSEHGSAGSLPDHSEIELPKPESCRQAGLECRNCVRHSAANLATVCRNLGPASLRDSFFKIYPDHACLPMARAFGRAYRAAQRAGGADEEPTDEYPLLAVAPA